MHVPSSGVICESLLNQGHDWLFPYSLLLNCCLSIQAQIGPSLSVLSFVTASTYLQTADTETEGVTAFPSCYYSNRKILAAVCMPTVRGDLQAVTNQIICKHISFRCPEGKLVLNPNARQHLSLL